MVVFDLAVEWLFLGLFFRSYHPGAGRSIPKEKNTTQSHANIIKLDAMIKSRNAAEVVFRKSIYKPNVTGDVWPSIDTSRSVASVRRSPPRADVGRS